MQPLAVGTFVDRYGSSDPLDAPDVPVESAVTINAPAIAAVIAAQPDRAKRLMHPSSATEWLEWSTVTRCADD
jgi:hypothetical protein